MIDAQGDLFITEPCSVLCCDSELGLFITKLINFSEIGGNRKYHLKVNYNPEMNYGLWIRMCRCRFIIGMKYTILLNHVANRVLSVHVGGGKGYKENLCCLLINFCGNPKTLKKVNFLS